jgi:hypothetical protein
MVAVIEALLLSGLMGMLGQSIRAIVGLKGIADQAADPNTPNPELFSAARLIVSLIIGFVAGAAAGLAMGLDKVSAVTLTDTQLLLSLMAAGYAGTDFIEGFMASYLPGQPPKIPAIQAPIPPQAPPAMAAPNLIAQTFTLGDAKVRAACEAEWDGYKSDCSGFVKAVGAQLGASIQGNANQIVQALTAGGVWKKLSNGVAAAAAAHQGSFVEGGLAGSAQAVPDASGHVVVVVDGQPYQGKYPYAYWGKLGGIGAKDQSINWAWKAPDRDNVIYAAYEP